MAEPLEIIGSVFKGVRRWQKNLKATRDQFKASQKKRTQSVQYLLKSLSSDKTREMIFQILP